MLPLVELRCFESDEILDIFRAHPCDSTESRMDEGSYVALVSHGGYHHDALAKTWWDYPHQVDFRQGHR